MPLFLGHKGFLCAWLGSKSCSVHPDVIPDPLEVALPLHTFLEFNAKVAIQLFPSVLPRDIAS